MGTLLAFNTDTRGVANDPGNHDMPESRIALGTNELRKAMAGRQ
jgi:hypothetical protein